MIKEKVFTVPVSMLLCLCMIFGALSGVFPAFTVLADAEQEPLGSGQSPEAEEAWDRSKHPNAAELFGEGAFYLVDDSGDHGGNTEKDPDKAGDGSTSAAIAAAGYESSKTIIDPAWFQATIKKMGANRPTAPYPLAGSGTTLWGVAGSLNLTIDPQTSGEWSGPKSGGVAWNDLGYIAVEAGYPSISSPYSGQDIDYGVASAYVGNTRVYQWGYVDLGEGENKATYLWVSSDKEGSIESVVVLPTPEDGVIKPVITLNYVPLEFDIKYEVTVDGKALSAVNIGDIWSAARWGTTLSSEEEVLNAVFGAERATTTVSQTTFFNVSIPKGYTAKVYSAGKLVTPENGSYGGWDLGADPVYYRDTNNDGDITINTNQGPGYFSLSEAYVAGPAGFANGTLVVKVNLTTRTSFTYNAAMWKQNGFEQGKFNADQNFSGTVNSTAENPAPPYTWWFKFDLNAHMPFMQRYGRCLNTIEINGEAIDVTYPNTEGLSNDNHRYNWDELVRVVGEDGLWTRADLSTGEHVEIKLVSIYRHNAKSALDFVYEITISNAYRNLTITDGDSIKNEGSWSFAVTPYLYLNSANGMEYVELRARNGLFSSWKYRGISVGGKRRTGNNRFEWNRGNDVRVVMKKGYAWPSADQNDSGGDAYAYFRSQDGSNTIKTQLSQSGNYWQGSPGKSPGGDFPTFTVDALPITYKIKYLPGMNIGDDGKATGGYGPNAELGFAESNFVLDKESMPFAGNGNVDSSTYTQLLGSNRFSVAHSAIPTGSSSGANYQFRYWVLTDANGNPVKMDGTSAASEEDWVIFESGSLEAITNYITYSHSAGVAAGFSSDSNKVEHTLYFTAQWQESAKPMYHYITFNTVADAENAEEQTWIAGDVYDKIAHAIASGEAMPEPGNADDLILALLQRSMPFNLEDLNLDQDGGIPITINKLALTKLIGELGGDYEWYTFATGDAAKKGTAVRNGKGVFHWESVKDGDELPVWFVYTLGHVTFKNNLNGFDSAADPLEFKITFTLPEENPYTYGSEKKYFDNHVDLQYTYVRQNGEETEEVTETVRIPASLIKKGSDGTYSINIRLHHEDKVTFLLPQGTKYAVEFIEREGYAVERVDADADTVWNPRNDVAYTPEANGQEKIVTPKEGKAYTIGYENGAILAYDTHAITLNTKGTYTLHLVQATTVQENVEDGKILDEDQLVVDPNLEVQNFDYLSYVATAKNLTTEKQKLVIKLKVETKSGASVEDRLLAIAQVNGKPVKGNPEDLLPDDDNAEEGAGDLAGTGSLGNRAMIDAMADDAPAEDGDTEIDKDAGTISGSDDYGTWIYELKYNTITYTVEEVPSGAEIRLIVRTTVPAVNGATTYNGSASLDAPEDEDVGVLPADQKVTANVFSNWLRIAAFIGNKDYTLTDKDAGQKFTFLITLDDNDDTDVDNTTIHYMFFKNSDAYGTEHEDSEQLELDLKTREDIIKDIQENHPELADFDTTQIDEKPTAFYALITLEHDQRAVIYDFVSNNADETNDLKNITYTVRWIPTADQATVYSDYVSSTGNVYDDKKGYYTGEIEDGIDMVVFRYIPSNSLEISKTVDGLSDKESYAFTFHVSLTAPEGIDLNDSYPIVYEKMDGGVALGTDQQGNTLTWNVGDPITLRHGQKAIILGLPAGTEYTVTESPDSNYAADAVVPDAPSGETAGQQGNGAADEDNPRSISGTIQTDYVDPATQATVTVHNRVAFTNTALGTLEIEKKVESSLPSDKSGTYKFTVTLENTAYANKTFGEYQFNAEGKATVKVSVTVVNGSGTATLKGIPADVTYTVAEETPASMSVTSQGETGTITAFTKQTATFTNMRPNGTLTINKTVPHFNANDDMTAFKFKVTLSDKSVNGEFTITGSEVTVTFTDGVAEVTVNVAVDPNGADTKTATGSITIEGLPVGVGYSIEEILEGDAAEIYDADWEDAVSGEDTCTGAIAAEGSAATCTNYKFYTYEITWTDLVYELAVEWDPQEHVYTGYTFKPVEGGGIVIVKNSGFLDITVGCEYVDKDDEYDRVSGSLAVLEAVPDTDEDTDTGEEALADPMSAVSNAENEGSGSDEVGPGEGGSDEDDPGTEPARTPVIGPQVLEPAKSITISVSLSGSMSFANPKIGDTIHVGICRITIGTPGADGE